MKWKGYADSENSWVTASDMFCWELLQDYLKKGNCLNNFSTKKHRPSSINSHTTTREKTRTQTPKQQSRMQPPKSREKRKPKTAPQTAAKNRQATSGSQDRSLPPDVIPSSQTSKTTSARRRRRRPPLAKVKPQVGESTAASDGIVNQKKRVNGANLCGPRQENTHLLNGHVPPPQASEKSPRDECSCDTTQHTGETNVTFALSPVQSPLGHNFSLQKRHTAFSMSKKSYQLPRKFQPDAIASPPSDSDICSQDSCDSLSSVSLNESFCLNLDSSDSSTISCSDSGTLSCSSDSGTISCGSDEDDESGTSWNIESMIEECDCVPDPPGPSIVVINTPPEPPFLSQIPSSNDVNHKRPNGIVFYPPAIPTLNSHPNHIRMNGFKTQVSFPLRKRVCPPRGSSPQLQNKAAKLPTDREGKENVPNHRTVVPQKTHEHTLNLSEVALIREVIGRGQHRLPSTQNDVSTTERPQQKQIEEDTEVWSVKRLRKRARSCSNSPLPSPSSTFLPANSVDFTQQAVALFQQQHPQPMELPAESVILLPPIMRQTDEKYQEQLLEWQYQLNNQRKGLEDFIFVENDVDFTPPPKDFTYITSNIYRYPVPDPAHPDNISSLCSCHCYDLGKKCGPRAEHCCPQMAGVQFAYTIAGKVKTPPGNAIYECNSKCGCPLDCANRVVQHKRVIPLCIFRTKDRGWGVKTIEHIKPNTFVTEYVGEVITSDEAERRGQEYDEQGETYLFDLDFNDDNAPFTIDAAKYGNISHFFNHSVSSVCANYIGCSFGIRSPRKSRGSHVTL